MNQQSSNDSTMFSPLDADLVSRRAYELWENEGRPEGSDLRHWLQAEQELRNNPSSARELEQNGLSSNTSAEVRPPQETRPVAGGSRGNKRDSSGPFSTGRNVNSGNRDNGGRRKPPSAPVF